MFEGCVMTGAVVVFSLGVSGDVIMMVRTTRVACGIGFKVVYHDDDGMVGSRYDAVSRP